MTPKRQSGRTLARVLAVLAALWPGWAGALDSSLTAPGADDALTNRLRAASLSMASEAQKLETPQEILAAANSDYRTLLQVLYDSGYFSPVIQIRLNGREAASIAPLNPPRSVERIEIEVTPGPRFLFGRARIAPLAPGTELPAGFAPGQTATTGMIRDAADAAAQGWREAGHALADIRGQKITADHRRDQINVDIRMEPGPALTFGALRLPDTTGVKLHRLRKIAGFPTGQPYHPDDVQKVATRLRRTGTFSSVSIVQDEAANPDSTLDFEAELVDQKLRRVTAGVELKSEQGLELSMGWIHRNLFGGAERLTFTGEVGNIGGTEQIDGLFSLRLDKPAAIGPDDILHYRFALERLNETHYSAGLIGMEVGVRRVFSDDLFIEAAFNASTTRSDDVFGDDRKFHILSLPVHAVWDRRDSAVDARKGFYLDAGASLFKGFSGAGSGGTLAADARGYWSPRGSDRFVLAGRVQIGSVIGADLDSVPPQMLYFSGGADTVRGQPYQSLGVPVTGGVAGGRGLLALSAELRAKVTSKISVVGFYDYGAVDAESFVSGASEHHAGAGIGVRYELGGIGPVRLDVGFPVSGATDDGAQLYLGIGQAF